MWCDQGNKKGRGVKAWGEFLDKILKGGLGKIGQSS